MLLNSLKSEDSNMYLILVIFSNSEKGFFMVRSMYVQCILPINMKSLYMFNVQVIQGRGIFFLLIGQKQEI